MLEKAVEIGLLYDYYGGLLTDRQKTIMELRYSEDLSLAEIAENLEISRQAVHDTITRTTLQLHEYEEKLGLVRNSFKRTEALRSLQKHLKDQGLIDEIVELLLKELKE